MSMGECFHPTDVELINYLKRFLKGECLPSQCPIWLADIHGDQLPCQIFGASNLEEKVRYFISPLKKRKKSDLRYCRTCASGTWRGQTSGDAIKNLKGTIAWFRRNFIYQSKCKDEKQHSSINWLMREYFVGDEFFRENDIPKQDFVVCRIKKNIKEKKKKDRVGVTYNMREQDVVGIIEAMLDGLADDYNTTQAATACQAKYQVMDETQKTNEKEHTRNFNDCFEEIDWADDILINIDDFVDIICC